MKIKITLLLLAFIAASSAKAQEKTPADSTKNNSDDVEVVISPKKGQDSTIVKVAGMKIIVLNDTEKETNTVIVDGEVIVSDTNEKGDKKGKGDNVSHWAGIRIGVNGYTNGDKGLPLVGSDQNLELDYGRSVSWDLNLFEKDFRLYKQYVELVTGLGMHFANYTFTSKYVTLNNTSPFTYNTDSTVNLSKNKLKATYITAPLMLGFSTNKDEDKAFRLAFGGQVSWRISSRLKQEYTSGGEIYKPRVRSDYNLTPFLFHAIASVGCGPINIYANYGLNPLFQSNQTANKLMPFDMGLQLMF